MGPQMEFLKSLVSALPGAASSAFALVAYISVVVGWVIIALKVKRNAQLLARIDKLPSKDRLTAIQLEMGAVKIKDDLTPEQWIRARVHNYLFLGFVILCLARVVVLVVAYSRGPGKADLDITPYDNPKGDSALSTPHWNPIPTTARSSFLKKGSDTPVDNEFNNSSGHYNGFAHSEFTLAYDYDRADDTINITPTLPYLSLLLKGGPISGVHYTWTPFAWQFPKLSIKIVNNTNQTIELTETAIEVKKSVVNIDPVIVIKEDRADVGYFTVANEGWGKVVDPVFTVGIKKPSACDAFPSEQPTITIARPTFDEEDFVRIDKYVPLYLKNEEVVCVFGQMQFANENAAKRKLNFYTLVSLVYPGPGAPAPPDYFYDVFLAAGAAGYTRRIPISEVVKPGEVDHFVVRIATDESASFNLTFAFVSRPKIRLQRTQVFLSVFVPRSHDRIALFTEHN
jgi:hypothetical protein